MSLHGKLGVNCHLLTDPAGWEAAARLGTTYARLDANFDSICLAPDVWSWRVLDDAVDGALRVGLTPYLTLSYCPAWLSPNRGEAPPDYYWRQFCEAVARRYQGRVTFLGCWNEFQGSAETYVHRLLAPMAEVCKMVDPSYRICGPDCATVGQWWGWLYDCLTRARGLLDVVTVHGYRATGRAVMDLLTKDRPDWLPRWSPWPEPSVRQVLRWAGYQNTPLALTETGWNCAKISEAQQAKNYEELFEAASSAEGLSAILGFNLINERREVQWGLLRADLSEKASAAIFRRYATPAAGIG